MTEQAHGDIGARVLTEDLACNVSRGKSTAGSEGGIRVPPGSHGTPVGVVSIAHTETF